MSHIRILFPIALLSFLAMPVAAQSPAPAQPVAAAPVTLTDNTALISNSRATVTKADYDAELLRMPADIRNVFATDPNRVSGLVNSLRTTKTLAAEARALGIDKERDAQRRVASETDRILAALLVERFEIEAGREFDTRSGTDQITRERYLVNKSKYLLPEQVSATHILFEVPKHSSDEAKKLAQDTRARIIAGADMNALAKEISEDTSARRNDGKLDWFAREKMDPAFSTAVFGLKTVGDISEPVQSRFGWHVIRLDGRRGGTTRPYDEVKPEIVVELRKAYIDERRATRIAELRDDPKTEINNAAIELLYVRPDQEAIKRATQGAKP
jgi:peptidyl-prolyl cis-trans isomerase C